MALQNSLKTLALSAHRASVRFRAVVGVPSALVVVSFMFVSLLTETLSDLFSSGHARAVGLAVLAGALVVLFARWEVPFRRSSRLGQTDHGKLAARRGLVVLVGLDSDRPDGALAKLLASAGGVEYLALLGTPESTERGVVQGVRDKLLPAAGIDLPASQLRVWDFGNAQSVADFEESATEAFAWMLRQGLEERDIVVDVSEGRRPMHFGALTAATAAMIEVQYLALEWNHRENRPLPGRSAFKIIRELH